MKLNEDELTTDNDTFYKWLDTCPVNSNIINLQGDNVESGFNFGGPALSLSRHIGAGISLGAQTSLGNVNNFNDSYTYTSLDGFLKFNLTNGSFVPSLIGGYGFSQFADGL